MAEALRLAVASRTDADRARREARALALSLGFGPADVERVALATSELATNLAIYARRGEIILTALGGGLQLESHDAGPGIRDLDEALADGFSTGGGLGSGLPATRRLMDEFEIASGPNGTNIVARKWAPKI